MIFIVFALLSFLLLSRAIVTIPILRLKGIYIILVTFGFAQLVMQIILSQSEYTGGTQGIVRIPGLYWFGHNMVRDGKFAYFYIALALLAASTLFLRLFVRSRAGAATVAVSGWESVKVHVASPEAPEAVTLY